MVQCFEIDHKYNKLLGVSYQLSADYAINILLSSLLKGRDLCFLEGDKFFKKRSSVRRRFEMTIIY
jgi:hypothetical protein